MPLLWRYLLSHYLKVFLLCVVTFVAILLTMRLEEIAYFATLGPQAFHVIYFALQQIPYILPIALPFSALISSVLLMQSLSQSHELTAIRACGFALRDVITPVLVAALFLSSLNFYIASELSTSSHLQAGVLKNQLRAVNPLLLLHNKSLMRMKGFYFDTLGASRIGDFARDIVFFAPGKNGSRMLMMTANQLQATPTTFIGEGVTLLNSQPQGAEGIEENLVVENMRESKTVIQDFSKIFEKKMWVVNNDHLQLPQLLIRLEDSNVEMAVAEKAGLKERAKEARTAANSVKAEILRRFSVAIAVTSFTLMGLAFSINIGRQKSRRGFVFMIGLGSMFLMAFFAAKGTGNLLSATLFYLLPHVLIVVASVWMLRRVSHGTE